MVEHFTLRDYPYEERRMDFFKQKRLEAERRMNHWSKRAVNGRYNSIQHEKACDAADEWNFFNDVIELLVGALRDALDKQPKWISVEDSEKPRHGRECLCICAMENDPKHKWDYQMVLKWYAYGSNGLVDRPHFQHEGCEGMTVTHWMPLPEPPEEGE